MQQVQITESPQHITIQFPNAIHVILERHVEKGLLGFQKISLGNRELLSKIARTEQPVFGLDVLNTEPVNTVSNWANYLTKRSENKPDNPKYESIWKWQSQGKRTMTTYLLKDATYNGYSTDNDSVMLHLSLEVDGQKHEVQWVFTPVMRQLGERSYLGVGWKFRLNNLDSAVWLKIEEPAKAYSNDWFFRFTLQSLVCLWFVPGGSIDYFSSD